MQARIFSIAKRNTTTAGNTDAQDKKRLKVERRLLGKRPNSIKGVTVKRKSLGTLGIKKLVDDNIVNFLMVMMQERSDALGLNNFTFGPNASHLFTRFLQPNHGNIDNLVGKFGKRRPINDVDHALLPINHNKNHWVLVDICIKMKIINFYDSKKSKSTFDQIIPNVKQFIKLYSGIDATEFNVNEMEVSQQGDDNYWDCGVFMLLFAERLSVNVAKFSFDVADINVFRSRIAQSIILKKFC